ncbi:GLPGLI family protein [Patiriisocius marinistellae]|nr:GLPGLI family protein [Patiriisocius marinistellae]
MYKKYLLVLIFTSFSGVVICQQFSGEAIYIEKKIYKEDVNRTQAENDRKALQLKRLYEKEMRLVFNENESYYDEVPSLSLQENAAYRMGFASGGGGYLSNGIYKNIDKKTFTEQREFLGKLFLIKDKLPALKWNVSKESKQIGEHLAIKATTTVAIILDSYSANSNEKVNYIVTAWFSPSIPVSHGPLFFQGLPGLILEIHGKDTVFLCKGLTIYKEDKLNIYPKNKGEELNEKQFHKIMQAKKEERKF